MSKIELLVNADGNIYDISELVTKISFEDVLNDGCSKLEFTLKDDQVGIDNGNGVRFIFDDEKIFNGFVFKVAPKKDKTINIVAYDQLRYCKAKDIIVSNGDTVTTLTTRMCNYFHLLKGDIADTKYILGKRLEDSRTWLDIIYTGIKDTLVDTGNLFCLRDEFGSIAIRNLDELKLDLIIGDEWYCYDYSYEKSIDNDFYNFIKIGVKKDNTYDSTIIEQDGESISKYGMLQYFVSVDSSNVNITQAKEKAKRLLYLYNNVTESLTLPCLGDTRIRAGTRFICLISDLNLNKEVIVKSVTHDFLPTHTMQIEVM